MAQRRSKMPDYQSAMNRKGEVVIGAYARQVRRQRVAIGLAGGSLIGVAVLLYALSGDDDGPVSKDGAPVAVECVKCKHRGVIRVQAGDTEFPRPCPKCGERACQKLWECRDCKEQFLPTGQGATIVCPECGSSNVGTAETPRQHSGEHESDAESAGDLDSRHLDEGEVGQAGTPPAGEVEEFGTGSNA